MSNSRSQSKRTPGHEREGAAPLDRTSLGWIPGPRSFDAVRYGMLAVVVICQAATIFITWPLWQTRDLPPNLPLLPWLPQFPLAIALLVGLACVLLNPRRGFWVYVALLAWAMVTDMTRCQPQMVAMLVLMAGCVFERLQDLVRWYLISLWLWAGVHKLLSPYWMGPVAWTMLDKSGVDALQYYVAYAIAIAVIEIGLAVLAWHKPRVAAPVCLLLHVGIAVQLLIIQWNYSVVPWNLATAIVGGWLLWRAGRVEEPEHRMVWPQPIWQQAVAAVLVIVPAGFYLGITPHFVAHVLYSDNMPKAIITRFGIPERILTWDTLNAPLPNEPFVYRRYFEATTAAGDKLHVSHIWPAQSDAFYIRRESGIEQIKSAEFFDPRTGNSRGIAIDHDPAIFALERAGARMLKRSEKGMVYAIEFSPDKFDSSQLRHLSGLPNLRQVQLANCPVDDDDMKHLASLYLLQGIGLDNTNVTDAGLRHLQSLKNVRVVEHAGTSITEAAIRELIR